MWRRRTEIVQEELALDGQMSRETRKAIISAARDCEIEYLAIGTTISTNPAPPPLKDIMLLFRSWRSPQPRQASAEKVAAIGPVQAQAGGPEDNTAV